ncbi:hypothetical protein AX774_g6594 [Zancudomyces culisetae]|uniref:Uncharacterized protein n=1 Tax=Zancudomyces culisetae TaxID=1213189 RepID=A0A1R1PGB7_ZANCU|nr:hypothetical protein AX774_g6594 [Zancudomyces culisetae]|eukprot:OMH79978.1 hypothetical protein AX774_g6594 [Zancudomyces culisetae]
MRLLVVSALLAATQLVSAGGHGHGHGRHGHHRHHRHHGRHGRGFYPGYYNFPYSPGAVFIGGRYWAWNTTPAVSFTKVLVFKPAVYDGQRFEFLYTTLPTFRTRWNGDIVFRRRWNRDIGFRRNWYSRYGCL